MHRFESVFYYKVVRGAAAVSTAALAGAFAMNIGWITGGWITGGPMKATFLDRALSGMFADKPEPMTPGWDIANIDHRLVDSWVRIFSTGKSQPRFATWLERKSKYEPMISRKLAERDMPQDLIYIAMIESGFNPKAHSRAKAGGLWQFISATGQRYGLTVNRRVDDRNNPEKATDAALSYLSDLHDRFGSWYLAAAAYNTGENRVGRIMREMTGKERGTDRDYYRISHRLPRETQDYVPMMIAAARISKNPARYGFGPEASSATAGALATGQKTARIAAE